MVPAATVLAARFGGNWCPRYAQRMDGADVLI